MELANEKRLDEANERIRHLEAELDVLRAARDTRVQRDESKILPETIDKKSRWWFTQI